MSFLSLEFIALFIVLLIILGIFKQPTVQKLVLLAVSCIFYAYWSWQFLVVIILVTLVNYAASLKVYGQEDPLLKRRWVLATVVFNLLVLGYFKYFNFFIDSLNNLFGSLGIQLGTLEILLPLGISFYIFETLSYILDINNGSTQPAKSLLDYALFATFFPRLVSGPIMRASHFLPQLERGVNFTRENFTAGFLFFGQGLLKKIVIADTLGVIVDRVYQFPDLFSSFTVWLGVISFSVQMYFDFSGYSDMATGVARMLGFEFPINFNLPFTSRNITEFWQRWHISLSTWLRDYIFLPYSRSMLRRNTSGRYLPNIFFPSIVTMLIGGLWHGATWGFVLWGGLHGLILAMERYTKIDRMAGRPRDLKKDFLPMIWVILLSSFLSVLFRAPSLSTAASVMKKLFFVNSQGVDWFFLPGFIYALMVVAGGIVVQRFNMDLTVLSLSKPQTLALIIVMFLVAFLFASGGVAPFLYFQF